jgi:selenocysteine lyase/cysteine desulfurase
VSLCVAGYDPQELAAILDSLHGIQTRAGLHCAPLAHQALGTLPGGTLRLSWGPFSTSEGIAAAVNALEQCAAAVSPG